MEARAALFWVWEWGTQCSDFRWSDGSIFGCAGCGVHVPEFCWNRTSFASFQFQLRSFLGDALLCLVLLGCTAVGVREMGAGFAPNGECNAAWLVRRALKLAFPKFLFICQRNTASILKHWRQFLGMACFVCHNGFVVCSMVKIF